jgi:hypothetical protein
LNSFATRRFAFARQTARLVHAYSRPLSALLAFAAACALGFGLSQAAPAGQAHAFTIAAYDGYGLQDCLGEDGECGHVVADAWCVAEGRGAALSYGRAPGAAGPAYVVTCSD